MIPELLECLQQEYNMSNGKEELNTHKQMQIKKSAEQC